ncbi:MAG TPA: ABC transporter permease [Bryobacteraceae bacterium]|nr:ABC transporter permease [Bryobacteraceae bacterium]
MHDLIYFARTVRKSPGFAAVAILTLALGVGANTAMFSVVKAAVIDQLPYRDPDRLVAIASASHDTPRPVTVDFTTTHDWRERSHSFESMSLYRFSSGAFVENGEPEVLNGLRVNYDFFETLGVKMELGRAFFREEDRSSTRYELILTHGLWVRRFGGDPHVLGRVVYLNDASFTIVGVLPPGFPELLVHQDTQIYMPLGYDLGAQDSCRGCQHLRLIGRLKPGVSSSQASAELNTIMAQIAREHPTSYPPDISVRVTPLGDYIFGRVSSALWILLAAVGLVLLIACANVANLLLARASGRVKEVALRAALGAGRARLVRQFLTESTLLAITGGAAGIALGWLGTRALVHFAPSGILRIQDVRIDATVLLFSLAVTVLTGILFGLAPALRFSRADLNDALKSTSSQAGSRSGIRATLAAAEFALAFVLVLAAGLLAKSFARLINVNPGYDPHNVLTLGTYVYGSRYQGKPQNEIALYDQAMEKLRANPGVESVAMVSTLPLGGFDRRAVHILDRKLPNDEADAPFADTYSITPEYFHVMRIPVLRGRAFTDADRAGAPLVAIVSEACARRLWPDQDALGKRIQLGGRDDAKPFATIVGIAGDIRQYSLDRAPNMEAYIPLAQNTDFGYSMVIRTAGDPRGMEQAAREAFAAADKTQPVYDVMPLESYLSATLSERTLTLTLLGLFGALALALAAIGIYGVISYALSLRTREMGIRIALGARGADVLGMALRHALALAAAGLGAGFAASLALTRFLSSLLYEVRPTDLGISLLTALLLTLVALAAGYLPARRATRVDPVIALRAE